MKFFTPQRYVDFNSDDVAIADRADAEWEQATKDYRKHLQSLQGALPAATFELANKLCLHDADYLGYTITPVPKSGGETATVAVQKDENVILLFYVLAEEPTLGPSLAADVFSDQRVHCLYDEVDRIDDGVFSHEVLLSNGRILSIRFVAFDLLTVNQRDFNRFAVEPISVPV